MIPRTIHQMFINPHDGGAEGIGVDVNTQCAEWGRLHPHYQHKMWSLQEFLHLCSSAARRDVADAVRLCRLPAMQADIARLLILREFGGFWADLKLYPLRPFLDAVRSASILFAEHFVKEGWHPGLPCTAFMGAPPRHEFFDTALSIALRRVGERTPHAFGVAGPAAIEHAITQHFGAARHTLGLMLPHSATWGRLFGVGGGSYNGPDDRMHWSRRQESEPVYVTAGLEANPAAGEDRRRLAALGGTELEQVVDSLGARWGFPPTVVVEIGAPLHSPTQNATVADWSDACARHYWTGAFA